MTTSTTGKVDLPTITNQIAQLASDGSVQNWDDVLALLRATGVLVEWLPFPSRYDELVSVDLITGMIAALGTHRPQ